MKANIGAIVYIALGGILSLLFSDLMFLAVGVGLAVSMGFFGDDEQKGQDRTEKRLQERIDTKKIKP